MKTHVFTAVFCGLTFIADASAQRAPDLQGFSAEGLRRVGAAYRAEVDKGTMAGAVTLVARNGRIVHYEAHGYHDAAKTRPMPKDSQFRMFSMTKPFVSVATMMLVEQGRLGLADPVADWLPELKDMKVMVEKRDATGNATYESMPAARPIRVMDLLRHTSGLTYADDAPHPPLREAYKAAGLRWTNVATGDEFVKSVASVPLAWQPGTRFEYGLSTDVLGVLLERLTGKPLDALLDEMVFRPLSMKDTTFSISADRRARLADALDSDPLKNEAWKWMDAEMAPGKRLRAGGAGAISTAEDYFRFCQMLLNGGELNGVRLLSRKTVQQMLSDQTEGLMPPSSTGAAPVFGFGLGFALRRRDGYGFSPGSGGEAFWGGYGATAFLIDPKERVVAISLSQGPSAHARLSSIFRQVFWGALVH